MATSTEESRATKIAEDLAVKLKLEQPVAAKLRTMFRNIAKDLTNVYSATGHAVNPDSYRDDISGILRNAYRRASTVFSSDITDQLSKNSKDDKDPLIAALYLLAVQKKTTVENQIQQIKVKKDANIHEYVNEVVPEKTDQITNTNRVRIGESIAAALGAAALMDNYPSQHQIAEMAGQHFEDSNLYRGDMIATDATQDGAESGKLIEAETIDDHLNEARQQGLTDVAAIKTWWTVGDDKVREAHREADGQQQSIDDAFVVDGELMLNPGDTSLGASPGNTINCRCTAEYSFEGETLRTVTAEDDTGFSVGG